MKKKYPKLPVMLISAATGSNINKVLDETVKILSKNPVAISKPKSENAAMHKVEPMFKIIRLDKGRVQITGKKTEELIAMTNFAQEEAVERLRKIFKKIGLEKALLKQDVEDGTIIIVNGREFEWNGSFNEEITNLPNRIGGYKTRESKAQRLAKRKARREKRGLSL
jgi:GTP-binding protein